MTMRRWRSGTDEPADEAKPRVGDRMEMFWGEETVLEVRPYTGLYRQWFKWVVRVTAHRTGRGWMETVV